MPELLALLGMSAALGAAWGLGWVVDRSRHWAIGLRRSRRRPPRPPGGALRCVAGHVVALRPVWSPLDGVRCAIAWSLVARGSVSAEAMTANDFVLRSPEGDFLVRAEGLFLDEGAEPPGFRVVPPLEGALADAAKAAGLPLAGLRACAEIPFFEGDYVVVTGELGEKPCARGDFAGYRAAPTMPTLSHAGIRRSRGGPVTGGRPR